MYNGLSNEEVKDRIAKNLCNNKKNSYSRSIKKIILSNIFTFFNFINLALGILIFTSGLPIDKVFTNCLFMIVIIINTLIAIFQEIKSKKIIDNLTISVQSQVHVMRDKKLKLINNDEIVLDDLLVLRSGDEVTVDTEIINSDMCEVDESVITGESRAIIKKTGDKLLSGAIIVAGSCKAKVISLGCQTFSGSLIKDANEIQDDESYLLKMINKLLKIVTIIIIPTSILLLISQLLIAKNPWQETVLSFVSAVIGMIPEGLVLLTTISLMAGVIKIAQKRTIVQKLNGIESLSLVDILCFDKTGTITDGTLKVVKTIKLDKNIDLDLIISNMLGDYLVNATDVALSNYFNSDKHLEIIKNIPFSSHRKYTAVSFKQNGTYALGALEYMIKKDLELYQAQISKYISSGYRVLTLVHSQDTTNNKILPTDCEVKAFIIIKDNIRKEALNTLKYFYRQDVKLNIISGDDPKTISNIAKQISFRGYNNYISGNDLPSDSLKLQEIVQQYNIFGRTNPYQKQQIISALKKNNTVGMVGDGVNDILALKEADCSVALLTDQSAAKSVSQIVLLDSNFSVLPQVVNEGRRVVNNITRVASLYLIKTTFSIILSFLTILLCIPYPFVPIQLTAISTICVGIPSFVLALEPNDSRIEEDFLIKVFKNAVPTGITIAINVLLLYLLCLTFKADFTNYSNVIVAVTGLLHLKVLYAISCPLTLLRKGLFITCTFGFLLCLFMFNQILLLPLITFFDIFMIILLFVIDITFIDFFNRLYDKFIKKISK